MCHIETANLDGETNLKQRECVKSPYLEVFSLKSDRVLIKYLFKFYSVITSLV